MSSERLSTLLSAYLDGALHPEEKRELEDLLLTSAEARSQFWDQTRLHERLRLVEHEQRASPDSPQAIGEPPRPWTEVAQGSSRRFWSWTHPLTAAAAGIVASALCTSAVWAFAGQRLGSGKAQSFSIPNPGFEAGAPIPAEGTPGQPGHWAGDFAKVVPAEDGIQPHEGRRMLRFLRSDNQKTAAGATTYVGSVTQVLDLRPFQKTRPASGTAQIEVGAWFVSAPSEESARYDFSIKVGTFRGTPNHAPELWEQGPKSSISYAERHAKAKPSLWQRLTVPIPIPDDAEFLVIECGAVSKKPRVAGAAAEFPGHYVDDITAQIRFLTDASP